MVERYEEVIEDWYKGNQEEDLTTYLCEKHVLKGGDTGKTGEKPQISCQGYVFTQQITINWSSSSR